MRSRNLLITVTLMDEAEIQRSNRNGARPLPSAADERAEFEPVMVLQLRDDLSRSRMREAFWISLVVHLVAIIVIALSPKWMPRGVPVRLRSAEQLLADKNLTYTEMPKDNQTAPKEVPNAKHLSDKNRIAMTKTPELDKKTLEDLRDTHRPGAPGMQAPQGMSQQPQAAQAPAPQGGQGQRGGGQPQAPTPQQNPMLAMNTQQRPNPFATSGSVGSMISQAARNSIHAGSRVGGGGDYGLGATPGSGRVRGNLEVLSDTQGVDFGPYLERVVHTVRQNWYTLIPEEARPPLLKRGKVAIEFAITPEGKVVGLRYAGYSGDVPLDRAAYGSITASNPFSPLPHEFHGPYLALRFYFFYNPEKGELE